MSDVLIVTINAEAKPKKAPVFSRHWSNRKGKQIVITRPNKETKMNEAFLKYSIMAAMKEQGFQKIVEGPVCLSFTEFRKIPKSFSKAQHAAAMADEIRPLTTPDRDNIEKSVSDAAKGIAFSDDNQVVDGRPIKRFDDGQGVRLVIVVHRWFKGVQLVTF